MTTPFAQDRPDWVPTLPATVVEVLDINPTQNAGVVNYGRKYVGTHPYLWVRALNGAGGLRVVLFWYASATSVNVLGSNEFDSNQTSDASGSFACQGAYVEILAEIPVVPDTFTLRIWSVLHPAQSATQAASSQLILSDASPIAAGATATFTASRCRWGWAAYSARLINGVAFNIQLRTVNYLGATEILDISDSEPVAVRGLTIIPPRPLQLTVFNGDAVPHNFYAKVTVHPIAGI